MNKTELVAAVAEKTGCQKNTTETTVNAILDTITQALANGEKVQLVGFGHFEVKQSARRTGGAITDTIEPKPRPKFKPGKALMEAVKK